MNCCKLCWYENCQCKPCNICREYTPPNKMYEWKELPLCEECFSKMEPITRENLVSAGLMEAINGNM